MIAEEGFVQLPRGVKDSILEFQLYILQRYRDGSERWPLAQRMIQNIAESLVKTLGISGAPVQPEQIASLLHVKVVYSNRRSREEGRLKPTPDGFEVMLYGQSDREDSFTRRRFTLAHECGHVLFFSFDRDGPVSIIPKGTISSKQNWREEGLCHDFARAILMPRFLTVEVESLAPQIGAFFSVARSFQVSPESLARRLLYDLKMWRESVLYRIWLGDASLEPKVDCFRGIDRKGSSSAPTSSAIKDKIKDLRDAGRVLKKLHEVYHFRREEVGLYGAELWFLL